MVQSIKFSVKIVLKTVLYSNKYTFSQNYFLNVYFTAEAAICRNCQTNCWKNLLIYKLYMYMYEKIFMKKINKKCIY